jgi:hypothetical protein
VTPKNILNTVRTWGSGFSSRTIWAAGSILFGIGAGVGSAIISLNTIGLTQADAPTEWQEWNLAEDSLTLPYALGHFLNSGQVPPTKASRQFVRRVDDKGQGLSASCVIELSGVVPVARWWTLSAAAADGSVASDRNVLSAGQAIFEANGKLVARISAAPSPGNWISAPSRGAVVLVLTLHDPTAAITATDLPTLTQGGC